MADPLSTQYLNATDEEKKRMLQDAEARAAATEQANQAYIGNLETAQDANNAAYDQATKNYNDLMAKYNNDFAAMVQGESDRIRQEREEAKTMIQADQKAAQWSGLTELASSVANMIGVGSFNAVSQQYKNYSQDWMQKADRDLREHRMRMDNVRARQNALKQQQLNLQIGQAGQALAREQERIKQQYNDRMALAEAERTAALQPMEIRSKAANEAGELGLKGMQTAAGIKAQEQSTAQGWARERRMQNEADFEKLAKGFVPDGKGGYKYDIETASKKLGVDSKYFGKDDTLAFPILDINGDVNMAHMSEKDMTAVLDFARGAIESDLGKDEADQFTREFNKKDDKQYRTEVLMKWMGKSPSCETAIRLHDKSYGGKHTLKNTPAVSGQAQPPADTTGVYGVYDEKAGF